jgi:FAD/FMN-containing dehydrogenase
MAAASTPLPPDRRLLVLPTDAAWNEARGAFNLLVDQRPAAVAFPRDERDVTALVSFAAEREVQLAPQTTAHNAGPLDSLERTILLNTSRFQSVSIEPADGRVRVGAGVKWGSVIPRLSDMRLAALHGSSPDVGIVGYSLGGGIGWLARAYGLQCNSVTAIELVSADAEMFRVDAEHEPELFWALRGGGGNFGVVTGIEFDVFPIASVHAGGLFFPFERAPEVLEIWSSLLPGLPDDLTTWALLAHVPDLPFVPQELRGKSFAVVLGACVGGEAQARDALAPLRRLEPAMDTFANVPPAALADLAMDPPEPVPYRSAHGLMEAFPAAVIADVVAASGPESGLLMVQLRHLEGALARRPTGAGARASLGGTLSMFAVGMVPDERVEQSVLGSLRALERACAPARCELSYPSFVEQPADASQLYDPETWRRLCEVKEAYDPQDVFRGNHHVPPAHLTAATRRGIVREAIAQ